MANKGHIVRILTAGLQILAGAGILAAAGILLYQYAQYGQRADETIRNMPDSSVPESETPEEASELLLEASELPEMIKVRILTDNFERNCHENLEFTSSSLFSVRNYDEETGAWKVVQSCSAGETFFVRADALEENRLMCVQSEENNGTIIVSSLSRAGGSPEYSGVLYFFEDNGEIALINELPLEEYLCGVVASEMPSNYPAEALKAQAVCARTYAVNCIRQNSRSQTGTEALLKYSNYKDFEEDLNDSVQFQVYNNYMATEQSRAAVRETSGEIITVSQIQYYSTACVTEQRDDLYENEAFCQYLKQQPEEGAEYGSRWLRWETALAQEQILDKLTGYGFEADEIEQLAVTQRAADGQALCLEITGNGRTVKVEGADRIRSVLAPGQSEVLLMDGTSVSDMQMLPSAYFFCDFNVDDMDDGDRDAIYLYGGGYGHGNGMSQCGAAALAADGWNYREILSYYYE